MEALRHSVEHPRRRHRRHASCHTRRRTLAGPVPARSTSPAAARPGRRFIGQLRRGEPCQGIPPPPWVHGFTAHANTSRGRDANACADSAGRHQLSKCVRSSPVNANSAIRRAVLATHQFYEFNHELVDARH